MKAEYYSDLHKVQKTIDSCVTAAHARTTRKMIKAFERKWKPSAVKEGTKTEVEHCNICLVLSHQSRINEIYFLEKTLQRTGSIKYV